MRKEAAYNVLVLAPLAPTPDRLGKVSVFPLPAQNPSGGLAAAAPVVRLDAGGPVDFAPASLDDFSPAVLARTLECFAGPEKPETAADDRDGGGSVVDDIMSMVDAGEAESESVDRPGSRAALMRAVLADPQFRELEAAWRGAELLAAGEDGPVLRAAAVNPTNVDDALEFLAGELADEPPDLTVLGLDLDASPRSFEIMRALARYADRLMTPVVFGLSPEFFGISDWSGLDSLRYLPHHLEDARYAPLGSLGKRDGAGWLLPVTGGAPCREAYAPGSGPFPFEDPGPPPVSPAFCMAAGIAAVAVETGWPGAPERVPELGYAMPESRAVELRETVIGALSGPDGAVHAARTVDGSPLGYRLRLARLVGYLLRLRAAGGAASPDQVRDEVRSGLEEIFSARGAAAPEMDISADYGEDGETVVSVSFELEGEPLSLSLHW